MKTLPITNNAHGHILRVCIYSPEARFIACMPSFQFFHASAVSCFLCALKSLVQLEP